VQIIPWLFLEWELFIEVPANSSTFGLLPIGGKTYKEKENYVK
jgi:hypothetical protein